MVLAGHEIHQRQGVAVFVGLNRLIHADVLRCFFVAAEIHEHFIFNASSSVAGKPDPLVAVERIDSFNQADSADGNEVVLVPRGGVIFLDHVRDQAQIVLNQLGAGGGIPVLQAGEAIALLLSGQRARERPRPGDMQNEK